jgi:hypothetical protein
VLDRFEGRWTGLVEIVRLDAGPGAIAPAGPAAVLIRPDGYVGFRASDADAAGFAALDAHLGSYLLPA